MIGLIPAMRHQQMRLHCRHCRCRRLHHRYHAELSCARPRSGLRPHPWQRRPRSGGASYLPQPRRPQVQMRAHGAGTQLPHLQLAGHRLVHRSRTSTPVVSPAHQQQHRCADRSALAAVAMIRLGPQLMPRARAPWRFRTLAPAPPPARGGGGVEAGLSVLHQMQAWLPRGRAGHASRHRPRSLKPGSSASRQTRAQRGRMPPSRRCHCRLQRRPLACRAAVQTWMPQQRHALRTRGWRRRRSCDAMIPQ